MIKNSIINHFQRPILQTCIETLKKFRIENGAVDRFEIADTETFAKEIIKRILSRVLGGDAD